MNYQRVYDQFIEARRHRALVDGVYYELHHIVPKSIGGGDDCQNMVNLTFREHVFAHELLARIHSRTPFARMMWGALIAMMRDATYGKTGMVKKGRGVSRRRVLQSLEAAKRHHAEVTKGDGSSAADRSVYSFENRDGRTFVGTRIQFMSAHGVRSHSLQGLMSGRTKSTVCGWSVPQLSIRGSEAQSSAKLHNSRTSGTYYQFINMMGESRRMTKSQMHSATGLSYQTIDRIVDRGEAVCGWAKL